MSIEQEKMIVEALPSLYPLKDYEEDAIRVVLDALPKRGNWVNDRCSVCGYEVMSWNHTPYCHRCGAKMEVAE